MPVPQWGVGAQDEAPLGAVRTSVVDWLWLRGLLGDGDGVPEGLDPGLEPLRLHSGIVAALEVVGTGVFVKGTGREQVPGGLQDGVSDGDCRLVGSASPGEVRIPVNSATRSG